MRRRPPRVPAPLAILLVVATVQFLAWALVLPAAQPDEGDHFAYAQRLVETGERPPLQSDGPRFSPELDNARLTAGLSALAGNLSARPYWSELDERLWRARDEALGPDARDALTGPNRAARNPPGYYAYTGAAYAAAWSGSFFDRLYVMRLANLPLYLLTIVMTWVLAGQLLGRARWPRTVAAGAVAVQPQCAFVVAGLSPDPLLMAIWAVFVVLAVRTVQRGSSWGAAAGLVALGVASVLTHPRGAPLALLALLAIGLGLRRRLASRFSARALAAGAAASVAAAGAVLLALIHAAGVLDSTSGAQLNVREFASYLWQFYMPRMSFMAPALGPDYGVQSAFVETFYGVFGSLEIRWPAAVYDALAAASLAGLAALVVVVIRARARLRPARDLVALLLAMPLTLLAALHFAAYRSLQIDPGDPILVGRYLFVLLPLFGVAVAIVVRALPARLAAAAGTAVLFAAALLGISGLGMTAVRFYV